MADDLLADLLSDNDDSLDSFYNLDKVETSKQSKNYICFVSVLRKSVFSNNMMEKSLYVISGLIHFV